MGSVLDSRYSWFRLAVTLAVAVVLNFGTWAFILVLPDVQREFGLDRGSVSLPYTATMIGFAAGNLLMGRFVDRFGMTAVLLGSVALFAAGFWAAAATHSIVLLALLQAVLGFGSAASFGPLIADVSHWFFRRRGIAVAVTASGNYLSGAVWPLVIGGFLAQNGWRETYQLVGLAGVVLVVPLALLLRRRLPEAARAVADARAQANASAVAFSPRTLQWLLALAGLACCTAMSMPQVHIVAYCADLGYGPAVGAEMLSLMLFGGVASRLMSGFLADRFGGVRTVLVGSALQCLALFLYLPFDALVPLYVVSLIFGLSQGGIVPGYAVIVREFLPAREAGARVGMVLMATVLGMALGGWMSGWIYDLTGSYRMAFLNGIAWNILNLAIAVLLLVRAGRGRSLAAA
jgi:MFS family permease